MESLPAYTFLLKQYSADMLLRSSKDYAKVTEKSKKVPQTRIFFSFRCYIFNDINYRHMK